LKAAKQDVWSLAQSGEALIHGLADFCLRAKDGVLHASLDIPMAILFRVEFWRVCWQILYMDFRMLLQKCFHQFGLMGARLIPDQDARAPYVAPKVFQPNQQFLGIDGPIEMSFVDPARNRQAGHRRCFPAKLGNPFQLGSLAFRCPRKADRLGIGVPEFIFKYDLGAEPLRFFLSLANPGSTRPGSIPHPVPLLSNLVSAHSSRDHPANG
jgi:hypothetical protein